MSLIQFALELVGSGAIGHVVSGQALAFYRRRKALKSADLDKLSSDVQEEIGVVEFHQLSQWKKQYAQYCRERKLHCEFADSCTCEPCVKKAQEAAEKYRGDYIQRDDYYSSSSSSFGSSWGSDSGGSSW